MRLDTRLKLFITLAAVFVSALVVGDIVGGKLMETTVFGQVLVLSVGIIPFPITFLLTDLLNEFYGKSAARVVTWVGFGMTIFTFTVITIAVALPWAPFTSAPDYVGMNEPSFNRIFGGSQRILIASMAAYLIAQFTDIAVFHLIKRLTRNRLLWLRATGSTAVSQLIDTVVIQIGAWWGVVHNDKLLSLIGSSYLIKLIVAIGLTPLIYGGHAIVERLFGIEPVILDERGQPTN